MSMATILKRTRYAQPACLVRVTTSRELSEQKATTVLWDQIIVHSISVR